MRIVAIIVAYHYKMQLTITLTAHIFYCTESLPLETYLE